MVEFNVRTFNEDDGKIIGAEVTVYSDSGDKIGVIDVADADKLRELEQQLALIDETYFTEERLATILANTSETETINATSLSGFQSSDFAKVSQLSAYAPVSHNHTKNQVTDLYNYQISASSYNVDIDTDVNITVKVTNQAGNPVVGVTVPVLKNNESWKSGTTGVNGTFTVSYTADSWGLVMFSASTSNLQINVKGWKTVQEETKFTAKCNGKSMSVRCAQTSNSTQGTSYNVGTISSGYRPQYQIVVPATSIGNNGIQFGFFRVGTDGAITLILSRDTSGSGVNTIYGTLEYSI